MSVTYTVWSKVSTQGRPHGWSRMTGGLTKEQAEWYAEVSYFQSTAMPDSETKGPDEQQQ